MGREGQSLLPLAGQRFALLVLQPFAIVLAQPAASYVLFMARMQT